MKNAAKATEMEAASRPAPHPTSSKHVPAVSPSRSKTASYSGRTPVS
jgi:hypothetical protein